MTRERQVIKKTGHCPVFLGVERRKRSNFKNYNKRPFSAAILKRNAFNLIKPAASF